ncbi:hypothetical protein [Collimonas sp.]|uniref:hypothetical protein n=1 Tax=Collimonas sp. TaxID=1963772 RepID=UPI002BE40198|nr:hypothetical protein [Collimonas sp.]HWX00323.1 hypothetical protein [Collimonas sp.]
MNRLILAAACFAALQGCTAMNEPLAPPSATTHAASSGAGCAADKQDDNALVGKTEQEATALLSGCVWRIGERDGEQFAGTMDYNEARRTLRIAAGKVTWVRRG